MRYFWLLISLSWSASTVCNVDATMLHRYLWANYQQFSGNLKQAANRYDQIFEQHAPVFVYKGYVHFLFESKDIQKIAPLVSTIDTSFKDDAEVQLMLAKTLEIMGQQRQSDEKLVTLGNTFSTNPDIVLQAAQVYMRRKEPENALKIIDTYLNKATATTNNFLFHFVKAQIFLNLDKKEDALKSVHESLAIYKGFDKSWFLMGLLEEHAAQHHESQGDVTQARKSIGSAIQGFSQFMKLTGSNREIEQHLKELIMKQKLLQHSFGKTGNCMDKALLLFEKKQLHEALEHIDQCLHEQTLNQQRNLEQFSMLS